MRRLLSGLILVLTIMGMGYFWKTKNVSKPGWQMYRNVKLGYEIKTPASWTREGVVGAAEVFWSPDRKAYVAVQFITEPRLLEEDGEKKVIKEIKEGFKKDQSYKLTSFESRFEEGSQVPATVSGYLARGSLKYQEEDYIFQEYAVQVANEEILAVIRGAIQEEAVEKYQKMVGEVMGSFNPVAGMREAFNLVEKQTEVADFEKRLAKVGKKVRYGIEDEGEAWLVQVYEIVEQNGEGHTATFNWYRVDKETGKITKEF